MLCPGTQNDCDNPGCRHGGCQGRLPQLPLFQRMRVVEMADDVIPESARRPVIEPAAPLGA